MCIRDRVSVVLSGMSNEEQIAKNLEYASRSKAGMFSAEDVYKRQGIIFTIDDIYSFSSKFREVLLCSVPQSLPDFRLKGLYNFTVKSATAFNSKFEMCYDEVKYLKDEDYRIVIFGGGESRCQRIASELSDRGINAALVGEGQEFVPVKGGVYICRGRLSTGFEDVYKRQQPFMAGICAANVLTVVSQALPQS